MATKPIINEEQQKKAIEEYNVELRYRSDAYWDAVESDNPIVQGFRFIMKNYDISFEKQQRLGNQGDGYRLCVNKKKRPRTDL
jgi:hypothetical protein